MIIKMILKIYNLGIDVCICFFQTLLTEISNQRSECFTTFSQSIKLQINLPELN